MKKIISLFFGLIIIFSGLQAQDYQSLIKKSKKLLSNYYFNQTENVNDLQEASKAIVEALAMPEGQTDWKSWMSKGQIFNELANNEIKAKIVNPNYEIKYPNAAVDAFEALKKSIEVIDKPKNKKEVLKLMLETENHLNNYGAFNFTDKKYNDAFANFKRTFEAYDLFKADNSEKDSRLNDPKVRDEQKLYTGYSAYYSDSKNGAIPYFTELADGGSDQPFIYEGLFTLLSDSGKETEGLKYLEMGRTKFPEETGLLFAEINHYIKQGKLNVLIDKLKKAIALDPKNVSVYTTLGSVYDQLNTKAYESNDTVAMKENFNNALTYFNKGLEIEPKNFDALYNSGALYYNSAANYTKEINKYADDFTPAGTKKYNDLKSKMLDLFSKALPYFLGAFEVNPKDLGVLQALKEIYARQDNLELAKKYSDLLNQAKAEQGK